MNEFGQLKGIAVKVFLTWNLSGAKKTFPEMTVGDAVDERNTWDFMYIFIIIYNNYYIYILLFIINIKFPIKLYN